MIDASLQKQLTITALSAAQLAGRILREKVNTALEVDFKGRVNLVTEADRSAEKIIIDTISNHFPEHQILAEESPFVENGSEFKWIIDPLDGTTNFVHGFPFFSISIGLEYRRELILGVVSIPLMNETFRAFKDSGAFLNDKPIQVSKVEKLAGSLLATGFPYENNVNFQRNFELFRRIYPQTQGVRRAG
ncbi:MAG: inositol monophosphatase family protein, partial [Candidatus Neomarinimicrobiota bacterium]|nr:inositol monophosphatase family protein [Candidatus Neomarinimicrobiota bacterium]